MGADNSFTDDGFDDLTRLLDDAVGEARSEGGLVSVKVDGRGRVSEVRLDPQVADVSVERLAEAITTVCADAFNDRLDRLAHVISDYDRTYGLPFGIRCHLHTSVDRLRGS